MKKLFGCIILMSLVLVSAFAWSGHYSIKCYRCIELTKQAKPTDFLICNGCPTWRCYGDEPDGYMMYRCPHGHTLYIKSDSDPKSRDLNEIFIMKNGKLVPVTTKD